MSGSVSCQRFQLEVLRQLPLRACHQRPSATKERVIPPTAPTRGQWCNRQQNLEWIPHQCRILCILLVIRYFLGTSAPEPVPRTGTSGRAFAPKRRACQKKLHKKNYYDSWNSKKHSKKKFQLLVLFKLYLIFFKINSKKKYRREKYPEEKNKHRCGVR